MNRRNLLTMLGMSPVALATVPTLAAKEKKPDQKKSAVTSGGPRLEVLNPRGLPPPITLIPMAKRLDKLNGKTVGILDIGFPNGGVFLDRVEEVLKSKYGVARFVRRAKPSPARPADDEVRKELIEACDAIVEGTSS